MELQGHYAKPYDAFMETGSAPRPAATTVVLRDGAHGLEVLLLRRHDDTPSAAGAFVFPGGGVSVADERMKTLMNGSISAEALELRLGTSDAAAYLGAALRELFEEAGLLITAEHVDAEQLARWRSGVLDGTQNFYDIFSQFGAERGPERLVYFAHWRTPEQRTRRFDTRFFALRAPDEQVASCDGYETVEHRWVRPADALQAYERGEWKFLLPTRTILAELAGAENVEAILEQWRTRPTISMIQPVEVTENGVTSVRLPV